MLFVELVPRNLEETIQDSVQILDSFPSVTGINIPDILRITNRSHDAVTPLLEKGIHALPHVRCIDRNLHDTLALTETLIEKGLKSILFIKGDPPPNISQKIYNISPLTVVEKTREAFPDLNIYCGLDPYRSSFKEEIAYARDKISAGANGIFTQPIFDPRLAEILLDQLSSTRFFIGVSPVITENSFNYWKQKNHAFFPKDFKLNLDYNCQLARKIIDITKAHGQHNYLMPIRVPVHDYLKGVLC